MTVRQLLYATTTVLALLALGGISVGNVDAINDKNPVLDNG